MITLTVISWAIWNEKEQTPLGIEHQEGYQNIQDKGCVGNIAGDGVCTEPGDGVCVCVCTHRAW